MDKVSLARCWTPEEMRELADRIEQRLDRVIRVSPVTAYLIVQALRAYARQPTRDEILDVLAYRFGSNRYSEAVLSAANLIHTMMHEGQTVAEHSQSLAALMARQGERREREG